MILAIGPIETEDGEPYPDMGQRSWRWIVELGWGSLSMLKQIRCRSMPEWTAAKSYVDLYFRPLHWRWGLNSIYYDGNHMAFSMGPFSVCWLD